MTQAALLNCKPALCPLKLIMRKQRLLRHGKHGKIAVGVCTLTSAALSNHMMLQLDSAS